MFKRIKQLKDVVSETPDLVRNAQAMQANAQIAPPGTGMMTTPAPPPAAAAPGAGQPGTEPISGVDLATYARVSRIASDRGADQSGFALVAAEHGISADAWNLAVSGWNARMQANHSLAQQFNSMWRGAV